MPSEGNKMQLNKEEYKNFKQIVNIFYNEEIEGINEDKEKIKKEGTIKIEPRIFYDKFSGDMKIEFKIGNKKMYKIKNLSEFYTRMLNKEFYRYGEKLQFIHTEEAFENNSRQLLEFVMKYAEVIKYANSNSNSNYKYYGKALSETSIIVGNSAIDDLFDVLKGRKIIFQKDCNTEEIEFTEEQPEIEFELKKTENKDYIIVPNIEIYKVNIIKGKEYKYILDDQKLYRCTKEFENSNLKLLELFRKNYINEVKLGEKELTQLFSIIIPRVKNAINLKNMTEDSIKKYMPKELIVKVFLDFDSNDYLIADVRFDYEGNEFNPLEENKKIKFPRNMLEETNALNIFRQTGFMLSLCVFLLEHENFSADVVPNEDYARHNDFAYPPFPRFAEKFRGPENRYLGQHSYAEVHSRFRYRKPDKPDYRENKKRFFRARGFFVGYLPEHESYRKQPIDRKSEAEPDRR